MLMLSPTQWARVQRANDRYGKAMDRLIRWQEARPFIAVGQCPYAIRLITVAIRAQQRILRCYEDAGASDEHVMVVDFTIAMLLAMLHEKPPPYPTTPKALYQGLCFLAYS